MVIAAVPNPNITGTSSMSRRDAMPNPAIAVALTPAAAAVSAMTDTAAMIALTADGKPTLKIALKCLHCSG
jgi:hypothetical protein